MTNELNEIERIKGFLIERHSINDCADFISKLLQEYYLKGIKAGKEEAIESIKSTKQEIIEKGSRFYGENKKELDSIVFGFDKCVDIIK